MPVSRDFRGRRKREAEPDRLPPGQYVTDDFPVLSAGPTPHTPLEEWSFAIVNGDETKTWSWDELHALPHETPTTDIHCVTRWSKFDTTWEGVSVDTLLAEVDHDAAVRARVLRRRLHDEPPDRGCDRRARRGSRSATTANRSSPSTAARPGCSYRICTSGRARSGCADSSCATRTSRASGSPTATTTTEIRGWSSGTRATDLAGRRPSGTSSTRRRGCGRSSSTCPTGWATEPASTWTSGSRPRTATAPSGPTRSPPLRASRSAITVERLEDGEVSPYLTDVLREGDQLELRGPIGGYFVWEPEDGGPLLLVAGGSGVVPFRAMLRHRRRTGSDVPCRLLYSSRTLEDVIYRAELAEHEDGVEVVQTLTRSHPPDWPGYSRRVDAEMLREVVWPAEAERARVRLRADQLRRGGRGWARGSRLRPDNR